MTLSKKLKEEINQLIKKLNKKNKTSIITSIKKLMDDGKYSERTQSVHYSEIKKIFKEHTNDKEFLHKIKPNDELTKKLIEEGAQRRDSVKLFEVNKELLQKILGYHNSNNIFELAIFLLLCSGRRTTELLNSNITNKTKTKKLIIDVVKKRKDNNTNLEFPVLIPKSSFLKTLRNFKKRYQYTNKSTFIRTLNRKIKRSLGANIHAHLLRKIYVNYLFNFRNKDNLTINPFVRDTLLQQSITSSNFYTGIKFNFKNDFIKKMKF